MSENKKQYRQLYVQVSAGEVYAFIPGNVMNIFVKEGDKVKKGDALLSLHAMKMDNNICSNIDGVVKSINVKKGQAVSKNDVLINVEPSLEE
ncbi:MAG: biotin/lipoyl-containing protein [Bacteroidales bacterium]